MILRIMVLAALIISITGLASAIDKTEYYFIVEENGNSIVAITIYGEGEIDLDVPLDVDSVIVEGGLYLIEDGVLSVAIGSTKKAVVLYTTSLLTSKTAENWNFEAKLDDLASQATVAMPKNVIVSSTKAGKIESGEILKILWDATSEIGVEYKFSNESRESFDPRNLIVVFVILVILGIGLPYYFKTSKKRGSLDRKGKVLKTLTDNERKIVEMLLKENGLVRRSVLERRLGFAKSSLATTLGNLERKKIVEIDKSYTAHSIKLSDWFRKI